MTKYKAGDEVTIGLHFTYLDNLRDSGKTNMFAAGNYLVRDRGLSDADANHVLGLWMDTFKEGSLARRVAKAINAPIGEKEAERG